MQEFGHEEAHRDITGGQHRAAVFGISDGLATNVSLILGFAGAHPATSVVRLAGIAGMLAGAFSMASGEYISMKAQQELFERELAIERRAIASSPDLEQAELVEIYVEQGIDLELAKKLAATMMRTPELALATHVKEELGVSTSALGSPVKAAITSLVTFAIGAFIPLVAWLFVGAPAAVWISIGLSSLAALAVGGFLGTLTGRSVAWSALRQFLVAAVAAGITFGVGHLIGVGTA